MSASLYAVRFADGEIKYGYTSGYTYWPDLFETTEAAWAAYPGKSDYRDPAFEDESGAGERVQFATLDALRAQWATATRNKLTSKLVQDDWAFAEEDFVHPKNVRYGPGRQQIEDWAEGI